MTWIIHWGKDRKIKQVLEKKRGGGFISIQQYHWCDSSWLWCDTVYFHDFFKGISWETNSYTCIKLTVDRVYRASARELEMERQLQTDESLWIGVNNLQSWQSKQTCSIFFKAGLIFQNFTVVFLPFIFLPDSTLWRSGFLQGIVLNSCPTNSSMRECPRGTLESFRFVPSSNTLVVSEQGLEGWEYAQQLLLLSMCCCFFFLSFL